ncbi:MAG TPA: cytochrome c biogenesis protein CcsA [Pyrinomonadaceae bacterium]|nr:cytochrome c biogenesis protein CcsA [Pyrinomonadaceae bacterium]
MSEVLKQPAIIGSSGQEAKAGRSVLISYLPAILALGGSVLLVLLRIRVGGEHFVSDGALMMLALASYLTAAVFHLTNLYAPTSWAQKLGLWCTTLGVFFNLSSWGVRWVAAHDREFQTYLSQGRLAEMPWAFRYIPFANLYDLSLAFAFGAGITTLLIAHRKNFRFLGAISLPLAALILLLARFIGGEFIELPAVLDSYWRPIHVGIASLSYGVALVCFAVAVIYLLKDGVKVEAFAIWSSIFAIAVIATISKFSVFSPSTFGTYTASTFIGDARSPIGLRANLPYVGWALVVSGVLLLATIITFIKYLWQKDEAARKWGRRLLKLSLVAQACAILLFVSQVKSAAAIKPCAETGGASAACIDERQYEKFAVWVHQQQKEAPEQIAMLSSEQLRAEGEEMVRRNAPLLKLSPKANPVELSALITAFAGTLFVTLFGFRTEKLREHLPPAEKLDSLVYKLAGVAFAGLALLLMTGAVWANESWGRYWGWDSKETGAFVAWLTYGAFLHSRIARGWHGRKSAYFAVVAFLLVIFTYLGVSYLLPGLHSYA